MPISTMAEELWDITSGTPFWSTKNKRKPLLSSDDPENSYIFLKSKEQDMIKFINRTAYYDTI